MNRIGLGNKTNRDDWIRAILGRIPERSRILDVGAGELQYRRFCGHLKYVSQDFCEYNGAGDKSGLQRGEWRQDKIDIISDIVSIPEPDDSFDAIMCTEVFEHIPEPIEAIKEFARLLKPNGYLVLTAPFCCLTHYSPYFFYTGFSRYFYEKYLIENGFNIIEIEENGNYFEYIAQEIRRLPEVTKRYTNAKLGMFSLGVMKFCLLILRRYSEIDTGSEELLNFGYHIFARRSEV